MTSLMDMIEISKNENYNRGVMLYDQGFYTEAIAEFERVLESVPDDSAPERKLAAFYICEAYVDMGISHLRMTMYRRAEEELKSALAIHPEYPDLHFYLAVVYYRQARYDDSENHLREALAINPNYARALIYLGLTRLRSGNEDGLNDIAEAVNIEPAYRDDRYERALSVYEDGDLDRFLQIVEEVAETDVDQISDLLERGLRLMKQKAYQNAVDVFLEAVSVCPHYADLRHYLGCCYMFLDMLDPAIAQLTKALEINPAFITARVDLATAYMEAGERQLAEKEIERALELYPGHPDAVCLLATLRQECCATHTGRMPRMR